MLVFETELGACGIEWSGAGVTRVLLPGRRPLGGSRIDEARDAPQAIRDAVGGIVALLAGEARDLREVVLDESDIDPFRQSVFEATRAIGPGRRQATARSPTPSGSRTRPALSAARSAATRFPSSSRATASSQRPAR
jgi:hypothetical protein